MNFFMGWECFNIKIFNLLGNFLMNKHIHEEAQSKQLQIEDTA